MGDIKIGLVVAKKGKAGSVSIGASKIGGKPSCPKDFTWPLNKLSEEPLGFVCQINMSEVQSVVPNSVLPKSGLMQFYCSLGETDLSTEQPPRAVVFHPKVDALIETDFPEGIDLVEADLAERPITISTEASDDAYLLGDMPDFNRSEFNDAFGSGEFVHLLELDAYMYVARKGKTSGSIFGEGFFTFVIKKSDLKNSNFDKTILVFEGGS